MQGLIKIALNLLESGQTPVLSPVDSLETKCKAGMLQFQQRIVDDGIELCLVEDFEKSYPAGALAEETAQHAVLRPDMTIFSGDVLDDVVCRGTQNILCVSCLLLGNSSRSNILLKELDCLGNLLRQARKRRAQKSDAEAPKKL